MQLTRRALLTRGAAGVGVALTGNVAGVFGASPAFAGNGRGTGYGRLVPDPDGLLDLPPGFTYQVISREGEALTGGPGIIPGRFDGTGAFPAPGRGVYLVRNSEYGSAFPAANPAVGSAAITYDPVAPGGTTTVHLDRNNNKLSEYVSIAGTASNCAGGITPWDTWLTCEEDETKAGTAGQTKDHGFVFEVDPATPSNTVPQPISGMGRFAHEAVAIDPGTGTCYLTEDANSPRGLLYRYEPTDTSGVYGSLHAGGALTAMKCSQGATHVPDLAPFATIGTTLQVTWVAVPHPLADAPNPSTRKQFADTEVTRSRKFEGIFWGDDRIYVVSSFAEGSHAGQVWSYDTTAQTLTLEVRFPSTNLDGALAGDSPDNICVSPYGGLILCEDSGGENYLLAVDDDGQTTALARNARELGVEFTGCIFSPDNKTLFANLQEPGITFAIRGPFTRIRRE